ncbi:MAG: class I SAM-dependent DNA methyltransferase [Candidatus Binataceae bacterium]
MDFAPFDRRGYPVTSVQTGYGEWANHYESTVAAELDRPLLETLKEVKWDKVRTAADLACGTGRSGSWLSQHGVRDIDGVDITREMLQLAKEKSIYRRLQLADAAATGLPSASYDACTLVLADEHLADLEPVYREAARLLAPDGSFILVGYHPFFLMSGTPTHYHRLNGEAVTIECYVHLFSEHHSAAKNAGLILSEFQERVIDGEWLLSRPKWREYTHWPVSFALVWRHGR